MEVFQIESDENGHSNLSRWPLASIPQLVPPPKQVGQTVWLECEFPQDVWVERARAAKIRQSRDKKMRGPGFEWLMNLCSVEALIVGGREAFRCIECQRTARVTGALQLDNNTFQTTELVILRRLRRWVRSANKKGPAWREANPQERSIVYQADCGKSCVTLYRESL